MHQYAVIIERNTINWAQRIHAGLGGTIEFAVVPQRKLDYDIHELGADEIHKVETIFCRNQASAETMAKLFAKSLPGTKVYVLETKAVAQSVPQDPTLTAVTEKGVVPR